MYLFYFIDVRRRILVLKAEYKLSHTLPHNINSFSPQNHHARMGAVKNKVPISQRNLSTPHQLVGIPL